ncbi:SPOR domain-containing protein [Paenibacillus sp. JCM 10914]|uniref:SPOR domain-containing protein n=1 Tax=Paenibacillus sp. JCM 10914 TaxID=1236974 RepID=UPI0003CC2CF8|nr:SPOR domain-containing protein [Paenibacillus sp. JCM 10914]GAE07609.1 hypothetical protein JCM10914_3847 [Paenibacillus sp. JCM 10914]
MNKARMTIRFDHNPPKAINKSLPRESGYDVEEPEPVPAYPILEDNLYDSHEAWIAERDRDDQVITNGEEMWYSYAEPVQPVAYDSSVHEYEYYRTRRPTVFWKIALSVTAAVVTGVLFGYMVLSMFNGGGEEQQAASQIEGSQGSVPAPGLPERTGKAAAPDTDTAQTPAGIPAQTFYMLQYGVFSSSERAEQAKGELLQSGIAAGRDLDDENRVYAGVSSDREQAKLLSNQLKAEGVELYVREISLPPLEPVVMVGQEAAFADYFTISGQLVSELSTLSATLLGKQEAAAAATEHMSSITNLHQQWMESMNLLASGLGPEAEAMLPVLRQAMNSSVTALAEYNKNQSKGHLWEIQTGMMNYVLGQKKLLEDL